MLNSRQKSIIKDLENATIPVTARQLASKYGASLRTIRNDIGEIAAYLDENDIEFIRIPGQGMRIITEKKVFDSFDRVYRNGDFVYMDERQRAVMLLMRFLFLENPLSASELCDTFLVSKGTMFTTIRKTNELIRENNLRIVRYQNKGYRLEGKAKSIVKLLENIIRSEGEETIYNTLTLFDNGYMNEKDLNGLSSTLQFIANEMSLYISYHYFLSIVIYCLVCRARGNSRSSGKRNSDSITKLVNQIEEQFGVHLSREAYVLLRYALNYATDFTDSSTGLDSDDRLPEAIDAMISYVDSSGMYQIQDDDTLRIDLLIHLKSTIDAIRSGMPRDNPLLEEIRSSYPNEFNLVKSASQKFSQIYPLDLNDDEIGYVTLYFLKSFDKREKIQETNVMVVCNTGRSASRLLATRLMNNIPDIHIVSMNSIYNIENDQRALDNVDFIISTIPLKNVGKPHIVISPLLQKNEISKIKEAIWISKSEVTTEGPIDEIAESLVEQYRTMEDSQMPGDISTYESNTLIPYSVTALLGEVSMNLMTLISELYPEKVPADKYGNISGLFAHVLMSIPRWQRGEFIKPYDDEELISQYQREYDAIRKYLLQESQRLGIQIPEAEVITILRYYIY